MHKKQAIYILFLAVGAMICSFCARVGNPSGGPKDITPPKLISAEPENYSTLFDARTIILRFDEFVKLNDVNQKLVVSPPLSERPDVHLRGKEIIIDLNSPLRENTTYTFNFGDAIADNNEGNIHENFTYVISTGVKLDSLVLGGNVVDAFTLKVPEETFAAMYDNLEDSAPLLQKPLYISKANKKGIFALRNLKQDTFRVIALKDVNGNFLYDPGVDMIAFLDTFLVLDPEEFSPVPETTSESDTATVTANDTIVPPTQEEKNIPGPTLYLRLFLEVIDNQYLKTVERPSNEFFRLIFNQPVKGSVRVTLLDDTAKTNWFLPEKYLLGDTLGYWLTDTTLIRSDKTDIRVTFNANDSSAIPVTDTVSIEVKLLSVRRPGRNKRETNEQPAERKVGVNLSVSSRTPLELNHQLVLFTSTPVKDWDTSRVHLFRLQDSLQYPIPFSLQRDSFHLRKYFIKTTWKPDTRYLFTLMPGAITDIYGYTNDTIRTPFHSRKTDEYGNLSIILNSIHNQTIIQVLDDKDNVKRETIVTSDTTVSFLFLKPAQYRIKAISDENRNGKWDTGNYLQHREPEPVSFYDKKLNIRANWDLQENWPVQFKK